MNSNTNSKKTKKIYTCSTCGESGHNASNKKFHPDYKYCSEDSEFMCELIDCATCKRPTMRKDMYWKEGGCCMTDLCEDCAPKVPAPRQPECCGKHCDETEGLKLGMGWNRWHFSVKDMITEQLWCENCYKDCVGNECKYCSQYYPYTEMTYHEGGAFGEALYCYDQYFCKSCVIGLSYLKSNGVIKPTETVA